MKVFRTLLLVAVSSALYGTAFAVSRCIPLKRNIKNLETSCTKGWRKNSMCSLTCRKGYVMRILSEDVDGPRHLSITTFCRTTKTQNLTWAVRDVDGTRARGGGYDILDIVCERNLGCDDIPPPIEVINCTNGTNYSNCTLKCKDGFVPHRHFYWDSSLQLSNIRESTPTFWSVCRKKNLSWDLHSIFGLLCVRLEKVREECFPIDLPDFIRIDCGYDIEQLLSFFAEEYDGEGHLVPTPTTTTTTTTTTAVPTTKPLPDFKSIDFTSLNRKEREELLRGVELRRPWPWWHQWQWQRCVEYLLEVLNNTSSTDDGGEINRKDVRSVLKEITDEMESKCRSAPPECTGPRCFAGGPDPTEAPQRVDCNLYCLWDGSKYTPCGKFVEGHKFTCLRCKLRGACTQGRVFG